MLNQLTISELTTRLSKREVSAREAYEEAGLVGCIAGKRPIGIYHYEKQFAEGGLLCEVWIFLFRVEQQLEDWPEKGQRETRWLDPTEAAALVNEGGLADKDLSTLAPIAFGA